MSGRDIAEWAMEHRADLNLYYVIWGQKIWNIDRDDPDKLWKEWRTMEPEEDITEDHWDHVHVSYK